MKPAVVILAGGEGSRIGGGKPLRLLKDRSLLDRAIRRALSWSEEVTIAARSRGQVGDPGLPVLLDPPGLEGPLGGLASALRLDRQAVLTIPCDMPFLPDDLPARLAEALGGRGVALAASGGHVHPVCGLWRADALAQVPAYAESGRRSLIGFAESIGYATVEWAGEPFFNVNSREDLAEAERRLASEIEDVDRRSGFDGGIPRP
jgi:molybdopterin-guanine dinucleotide biosynthesis protein A